MNATVASDEETAYGKDEQAPTLQTLPQLAPQQKPQQPDALAEEANRLSKHLPKPQLLQIPPLDTCDSTSPSGKGVQLDHCWTTLFPKLMLHI